MKKKFQTIAALAMSLAAVSPTQAPGKSIAPIEQQQNQGNKQEAIMQISERKGQGLQVNHSGGLDFDYPAMFRHPSPIFEPKRPHPIQSYRSQQRAAKKRKS